MTSRSLRRRDGGITLYGIGIIGFLVVPMIVVLSLTSQISIGSTQAQGVAYDVAYTALNRSVDYAATQNAANIVLSQDSNFASDLNTVAQATSATATGSGADRTSYDSPAVGVYSVGLAPDQAVAQTGGVCPGGGLTDLGNGGFANSSGQLVCWNDPRQSGAASSHFSSGTLAQMRFSVNLFGGGVFSSTRNGVAIFGRPCQRGAISCAH